MVFFGVVVVLEVIWGWDFGFYRSVVMLVELLGFLGFFFVLNFFVRVLWYL